MVDATSPLVWRHNPGTKFCVTLVLNGVERAWEISKGIPRAHDFPATGAYFRMDKHFKKQVALSDNITNSEGMALVSARLRELIESKKPKRVEFLKVKLIDHKDKEVKDDFFILHPTAIVDCIDTQKSTVQWNAIDPDMIAGIKNMVLKPGSIDPELMFFRPRHKERNVFIRRDVGEEIKAGGFTGVIFLEPAKFIG